MVPAHIFFSFLTVLSAAGIDKPAARLELLALRRLDAAYSKTVKKLLNTRSGIERIHQKSTFNLHNNAYKTYMSGVLDIYNKVGAESILRKNVNKGYATIRLPSEVSKFRNKQHNAFCMTGAQKIRGAAVEPWRRWAWSALHSPPLASNRNGIRPFFSSTS
jgi:hypothetical protein